MWPWSQLVDQNPLITSHKELHAQDADDALCEDDIVLLLASLVGAGSEATSMVGTSIVRMLLDEPASLERLRNDRSLIRRSIDEILRYAFSHPSGTLRYALHDFELRGKQIGKGESITTALAGANRDPEVHPDPDRFDIERKDIRLQSFGGGAHLCLGAHLARLEAQEAGLRSIEPAVIRMRADARDLVHAAEAARGTRSETPEERQTFFQDQFQGVASATGELAARLERQDDAATAGAVLHASWATHGALDLPLQELGPEGAVAFARKVEGLYARYQARSNQLAAERRSVRRLLDVLIERQLAQRLDTLFGGENAIGLGALLSGEGKSQEWGELGSVVARTLGLPAGGSAFDVSRNEASLERLDYFARGEHRGTP